MILVRWLARTWSALSAPPPVPLPGPRALPSYARMGRYIAGGVALDPRIDLLVRHLAAELSGCRWCVEHGLHRWRQAFLPVAELGGKVPHERSEEHTSELQSQSNLVCRLLLEKKKKGKWSCSRRQPASLLCATLHLGIPGHVLPDLTTCFRAVHRPTDYGPECGLSLLSRDTLS